MILSLLLLFIWTGTMERAQCKFWKMTGYLHVAPSAELLCPWAGHIILVLFVDNSLAWFVSHVTFQAPFTGRLPLLAVYLAFSLCSNQVQLALMARPPNL
jgi:hypothetical protein